MYGRSRCTVTALCVAVILAGGLLQSCKKKPVTPVRVGPAAKIIAVNGQYYKGTMNSSTLSPSVVLRTADSDSNPVGHIWLHFRLLEGDGHLSIPPSDSAETYPSGDLPLTYDFNGQLGYAKLRVIFAGKDSVDLFLRANTLALGTHAQAQYIRAGDTYALAKQFDGTPMRIDVDPNFYQNYAVYETTLGLVLVVEDRNQNLTIEDTEKVVAMIVNNNGANGEYKGKTAEGIGMGSTYTSIRAAYGSADTVRLDPTPPAAVVLRYVSRGLTVYCTTTDTTAFEMHISQPSLPPVIERRLSTRDYPPSVTSATFTRYRK